MRGMLLNQAVKINPNSFESYYNLGLAQADLKDYVSASVSFRQAAKLNDVDADVHYQLGYSYYKLGKIKSCLRRVSCFA